MHALSKEIEHMY